MGGYIAVPEGSATFWGNGSLEAVLSLERGPVRIVIYGSGATVEGEAPVLQVELEGRVVDRVRISTGHGYVVTTNVRKSGKVLLRLAFKNHLAKPNPLEGRTLYVEKVSVSQGT